MIKEDKRIVALIKIVGHLKKEIDILKEMILKIKYFILKEGEYR